MIYLGKPFIKRRSYKIAFELSKKEAMASDIHKLGINPNMPILLEIMQRFVESDIFKDETKPTLYKTSKKDYYNPDLIYIEFTCKSKSGKRRSIFKDQILIDIYKEIYTIKLRSLPFPCVFFSLQFIKQINMISIFLVFHQISDTT